MAIENVSPVHPDVSFSEPSQHNLDSGITLLLVLGGLYGFARNGLIDELSNFKEEFPVPQASPGHIFNFNAHAEQFGRYNIPLPVVADYISGNFDQYAEKRNKILSELIQALYRDPTAELACDIILLALGHASELVRTAAAVSFLDVFDNISLGMRQLLSILMSNANNMAVEIAETALRKFANVASVRFGPPPNAPDAPINDVAGTSSLIVHGSHFAFVGGKIGNWWRSGGDFHTYLKANHRPNLYSLPDAYTWSGGYSDHARNLAAIELNQWVANRGISNLDIYAHSHGGSVVMWATHLGLKVNNLFLLSCPVHKSHYLPEFSRVGQITSYQVKLDWVILADGGGIYFKEKNIIDHPIPKWFRSHTDTHDRHIWEKYNLGF
ncbi:hypothetical protein [uncultured Sneathiella sp.]|uniref:hypothetical protein n=1 Tax=uncultured Sneathiella sp. TaxID=879315 RepID=UPI0030D9C21F|tara:strand:+ start:6900 stop:8045 length:1146 start_codon:yes stop_codon:yes gene_type:complete